MKHFGFDKLGGYDEYVFTNLSKNYNFKFNLYEDEINKIINEKMSWKNNENIKKSLVEYYYNNNQYVL